MRRVLLLVLLLAAGGCAPRPVAQSLPASPSPSPSPSSSPSRSPAASPSPSPSSAPPTPVLTDCGRLPVKVNDIFLHGRAKPPATCQQTRAVIPAAHARWKAHQVSQFTYDGWTCSWQTSGMSILPNDDLVCTKGNLSVDGYVDWAQ